MKANITVYSAEIKENFYSTTIDNENFIIHIDRAILCLSIDTHIYLCQ